MGAVYLAEHIVIEKKLALKVLAPELARRPDLVARFLQEARSASKIGHENVIDISDFGQSSDGYVYIAMEFLDGKDLGEIVRKSGPLAWGKTREIVLQICRALRAAHDKGVVHRDMKPENIFLIHREGQPHFVKILDFGIAKLMGIDPNGPRLTRTGMIFGTPEYMAPEQAEGKDADHRVDIYAVGCILYHLITGQTPFIADSFMTMLTKHLLEDPVAPSVRRPDLKITPDMDALVLKALAKDRDHRWQSMPELLEAILACHGPDSIIPPLPRAETIQMGGAHSPSAPSAHQPIEQVVRNPELSPSSTQASLADEERIERPRRTSGNKSIYIVVGLVLGIGGALWLALSKQAPPSSTEVPPPATSLEATAVSTQSQPKPTDSPPPGPTPGTGVVPVPKSAGDVEQVPNAGTPAPSGTKHERRARQPGHKSHRTGPSSPRGPMKDEPSTPTPKGLKPFPKL
jgi:serine/threonine protein kinase